MALEKVVEDRAIEDLDESSEDRSTNPTNSTSFREIARMRLSRRGVLQGTLAAAATSFLTPKPGYADEGELLWGRKNASKGPLLDFAPLTTEEAVAAGGKTITISADYEYDVLIPWGAPIDPGNGIAAYEGDPNTRPTSFEQEQMVGIGHDGMWLFPQNTPSVLDLEASRGRPLAARVRRALLSNDSGLLCVNHEFGRNSHVLGKAAPESLEDVRVSQAAHGVSVVRIARDSDGKWQHVSSNFNRRITVNTPMSFSGPVAGSELLMNDANNPALGTVNNCGSGPTPWGTYVTCEENFNGYFGSTTEDGSFGGFDDIQDAGYERYGFSDFGFGYAWHEYDERFDLSNPAYANESNRFGWCVEIDPFNPSANPVKRTALGRFKHEAVAFKELDDGRVAVYMGDDQRGDYCYKYESKFPWRLSIERGDSPLDDGKLFAARFDSEITGDGAGSGRWIELTPANPLIAAAGLTTRELVLTYARMAADAVGATPMDRPEWSTIGTKGQVFWTLTNNDRKDDGQGAVSGPNPIFENSDGYVISTTDITPTIFEWSMFVIARNTRGSDPESGDPNDLPFAEYTAPADGGANVFTDPDAAYADPFGRLYIGTDGGQPDGLQDQLVVFDVESGEYRRLLMGVNSDEITGLATTPDHETLFTNTQHPGNGDPTSTNFPAPDDGVTIPRDATIVITKKKT